MRESSTSSVAVCRPAFFHSRTPGKNRRPHFRQGAGAAAPATRLLPPVKPPDNCPSPFDSAPAGPLPTSLQVNADNLAEAIAPGAASSAYEPMAPPLSQHDIERIEAILAGRVAPDTYVPDDADMEKKVGA